MMQSIQSSLKKWMNENEDFQRRYNELKQKLLNDPHVISFLQAHPELTEHDIERNLNKLYEYTTQSIECNKCQSYDQCQNILKGYTPLLNVQNKDIHLSYQKCQNRLNFEQQKRERRLI